MKTHFLLSVIVTQIISLFGLAQVTENPDDILVSKDGQPSVLLVGSFHFAYYNLDAHVTKEEDQVNVLLPERQKEMEAEYLKLYKTEPMKANDMLQQFSDSILLHALDVADALTEKLFTLLAQDIQKEYLFHGA